MADLIIYKLTPNTDSGETVWTPFLYSFSAETDFMINPENLDAEICGVGPLLNQYGDAHSRLQAQVERHKRDLEFVYSKLYLDKREELMNAGDKAPDAVVKAHVVTDTEYQEASNMYVDSQRYAILAEGWWKSIMKKADLIQALAYKLNSEIKRGAF